MSKKRRGMIFHRTQRGKTAETWTTIVDGRWITLKSLDATEARAEALELRAAAGKTGAAAAATAVNHQDEGIPKYTGPSFRDQGDAAGKFTAAFSAPPPTQNVPGTNGPGPPGGQSDAGGQTAPSTEGKTGGDPGGKTSDAGAGFASDVNGAASDAQAKAAAAAAAAADAGIDVEDLDDFVNELVGGAASVAVEVQIRIQEWAWKRYGKIQVARVAPDSEARAPGVKLWGHFIRRMLPSKIPIPDWVAAIAVVAMKTTEVQLGPGAHVVGQPPPAAAHDRGGDVVDADFQQAA